MTPKQFRIQTLNAIDAAGLSRFPDDRYEVGAGVQNPHALLLRSAPDRLHTIVPGMVIAHTLADTFAAEDILYSDSGVREGYIWKEIIGAEQR